MVQRLVGLARAVFPTLLVLQREAGQTGRVYCWYNPLEGVKGKRVVRRTHVG
jgi:hypothetical protein